MEGFFPSQACVGFYQCDVCDAAAVPGMILTDQAMVHQQCWVILVFHPPKN